MASIADLVALIQFPTEKLAVEYKSWLNLNENTSRATLAKAAIALANEGGGVVVLGMRPDNAQGGALISEGRPADIARYSQDGINAAINRYANPQFHCELAFANHPATDHEHAFVLVPGGMTVPVMCIRTCEGVIASQRCYVRKPGPRSEEPFTAEEWRGVMERCIAARRENMLDAIRVIVQGHGSSNQPAVALDADAVEQVVVHRQQHLEGAEAVDPADTLMRFERTAVERWNQISEQLPPDDDARMPLGHYEIAFQLIDVPAAASLGELLRRMTFVSQIRYTGWGPFIQMHRDELEPRVFNGTVEAWLGRPVEDRVMRDSGHCDFWCASPAGCFFLLRGYEEDGALVQEVEPGSVLDITLPIWRVGETLLYASRIARSFADNPRISVRCHYTNLAGRHLGSVDPLRRFFMDDSRVCHDAEARLAITTTAAELHDNLVEILHPLLAPLYERFRFFQLPIELVRTEINRMKASRF